MDLTDKVAVITGAAGGIGLGMARAALAHGMRVTIADLDAARVEEAAAALNADSRVTTHACDVRAFDQVEGLREAALADHGRIDLLCNNAGIGLARSVTDCSPTDWQVLFDVNVTGVINGIRAFLPLLVSQGHGHMSATASLSGLIADPDLVIYNGTKFAVVGLMEALALEMRRDHPDVSASVLCPGPVATDLIATSGKSLADAGSAGSDDHAVAEYLARGMHPDEVGRVAIDGIANGNFWLLSHPDDTLALLEPRLAAMRDRELFVADDWVDT